MANELIINASLPETRIALMEDGEIQELLIERASGKGIVGNIYKGRVTRVLPGMQAAFVDIGLEKAAFLYVDDVYVHSELWEEEEGAAPAGRALAEIQAEDSQGASGDASPVKIRPLKTEVAEGGSAPAALQESSEEGVAESMPESASQMSSEGHSGVQESSGFEEMPEDSIGNRLDPLPLDSRGTLAHSLEDSEQSISDSDLVQDYGDPQDDEEDEDESGTPQKMAADPNDSDGDSSSPKDQPEGTLAPESRADSLPQDGGAEVSEKSEGPSAGASEEGDVGAGPARRRHRRSRRGGRMRKNASAQGNSSGHGSGSSRGKSPERNPESYPENYHEHVADTGKSDSDRSNLMATQQGEQLAVEASSQGRPEAPQAEGATERRVVVPSSDRSEFQAQRGRDRRIRPKAASRPARGQVNIQDLLKEGQEVLVQVAKDPIATKGARLTCHISLPGRHLVCMPTIDHVGVSRRIEREDERRRLREFVERNRPRNLGFIVRTASGRQQSEKRIKQDIDYLTRLWSEIKEKAASATAPALVYEDLNAVLRAIRDWVTEEIDKVIVDSRYHFNEIQRFVSHFMPSLKQKVDLYHGDIPIFDAYGISTELSRALERKVWLKSGGYIVIDQAEALVAIDVNTGRYVGKKNLEDTILKTNLEAVQEIAYQLRLRNCGGIIIIDLIDMEKDENKRRVYRALEDALSRDRARPTILKISELGLIEMTRKRTRDTIVRSLCESCTHCEGKGFIKSKQTVAYEALREIERAGIDRETSKILVQAHPDVIDILAIDERETLDQLERRYRKSIYLQAVNDYHAEQFEVSADKVSKPDRLRDDSASDRSSSDSSREHHSERHRHRNREKTRREHHHGSHQQSGGASGSSDGGAREVVVRPVQSVNSEAAQEKKRVLSPEIQPQEVVSQAPSVAPADTDPSSDGFFDEEDRLAFLRAQAAQDAALARLGTAHHPQANARAGGQRGGENSNRGERSGNGGGGRRSTRNARRGGKFRRGGDRDRQQNRSSRQFGGNSSGNKWQEQGNRDSGVALSAPSSVAVPVVAAAGESRGRSDEGGSGGASGGAE
ncbi:MAG: Rne/Rng family ribonuclease [Bdellovibrionia bacterium]